MLAALIVGVFIGIAGDRFYLFRTGRFFPKRAADFAARHIVDRLDRELHLDAAQKVGIQKIVDEHHGRIEAAWNNVRPQVHREIAATNVEIERLLTPEQRETFKRMKMRMDSRHGSGRGRR